MNDYREKFEELQQKDTFRGQQWRNERGRLVREYSWAVPNEEVLDYLGQFDYMYEAGAGNGYWASLIEERGTDIEAFDAEPPDNCYTDVETALVCERENRIEGWPVLLVWPPYDMKMAETVAQAAPSHILYVGEPRGGCTGNDAFFDIVEREYLLEECIQIPSYEGIRDDFYHYVRKI